MGKNTDSIVSLVVGNKNLLHTVELGNLAGDLGGLGACNQRSNGATQLLRSGKSVKVGGRKHTASVLNDGEGRKQAVQPDRSGESRAEN